MRDDGHEAAIGWLYLLGLMRGVAGDVRLQVSKKRQVWRLRPRSSSTIHEGLPGTGVAKVKAGVACSLPAASKARMRR